MAIETNLLEFLLPSPSIEQNSAIEDNLDYNNLNILLYSIVLIIKSLTIVLDLTKELVK
jgi:hypothetical protein